MEFKHAWPLQMVHIAEQLNPTFTQPHRFPQPDLQLHEINFKTPPVTSRVPEDTSCHLQETSRHHMSPPGVHKTPPVTSSRPQDTTCHPQEASRHHLSHPGASRHHLSRHPAVSVLSIPPPCNPTTYNLCLSYHPVASSMPGPPPCNLLCLFHHPVRLFWG